MFVVFVFICVFFLFIIMADAILVWYTRYACKLMVYGVFCVIFLDKIRKYFCFYFYLSSFLESYSHAPVQRASL